MVPKVLYETTRSINVIYRCKGCRKVTRKTYSVRSKSTDNQHPVMYLQRTHIEHWIDGAYCGFNSPMKFPVLLCGCKRYVSGKRIDGTYSDRKCDARCTGATGHDCECSCGGENHGKDHAG